MNIKNLLLVTKREYLTRVRRKSFILATLLTPIGFAIFIGVIQLIFSYGDDERQVIAVVDQGNVLGGPLRDSDNLYFKMTDLSPDTLRENIRRGDSEFTGALIIPPIRNVRTKDIRVDYFSDGQLGMEAELAMGSRIEKGIRDYKMRQLELDEEAVAALNTNVRFDKQKLVAGADGEEEDESTAATFVGVGIGTFMGFLMYMVVIIYGMMVMRSVMEEKMNRIVEVIISTVRPTTLLLGKILGVGLVGLTQLAAWIILIPALGFLVLLLFGYDPAAAQEMQAASGGPAIDPEQAQSMVEETIEGLGKLNWWLIIPCFLIFFLGGYFTYAAMFAAVGSAMGDDLGEGQALTLPIMIPVVLALYIVMAAMKAPNSSLAVISSFLPLFAPIVMPARLAFDPPLWQVLLSLLVTIGFAAFMVWLAGRIYRIGILNYGKAGSFKDIGRWMFSKY